MEQIPFKIDNSPRGILVRAAIWTIICGITAIPSYIVARGDFSTGGMVVGVLWFAVMYTAVSGTSVVARWRGSRLTNRTFRIGYFTRVVVSAIVPMGMALDLIPGVASVALVSSIQGQDMLSGRVRADFFSTLAITLVQGTLLHVTLGAYMLIVHLIQWWWVGKEYPEGHCRKCGYDLRASYEFGRCPECGARCGPGAEGSPDVPTAAAAEMTLGKTRADVDNDPGNPAR